MAEEGTVARRVALFDEHHRLQRLPHIDPPCSIRIRLPDGTVKTGEKWVTTPLAVASQLSPAFAEAVVVAKVDGELWDAFRPLEADCTLDLFTLESPVGHQLFLHSTAHILAQALDMEYDCVACTASCVPSSEGFYYDSFVKELVCNQNQKQIEAILEKKVAMVTPFERIEITRQEALEIFKDSRLKVSIINLLPEDNLVTVYKCGSLVDLCRGPNIPHTSFVSNGFTTLLRDHEEIRQNHHRKLGEQNDILISDPLSPGTRFLLPHGARVYNQIKDFVRSQYLQRDYEEVVGRARMEFCNCRAHLLLFKHRQPLYVPTRFFDFGAVQRDSAVGEVSELRDSAHIVCMESQVMDEVLAHLHQIKCVYDRFGFTFNFTVLTRPEDYFGDLDLWKETETALEDALRMARLPWTRSIGGGAKHGPSIKIRVFDAFSREYNWPTLQLDFCLPSEFNLSYKPAPKAKAERLVIIHLNLIASVEETLSTILEHYKGKWPFWLSPRQVMVCTVSGKCNEYANLVHEQIKKAGFYVDLGLSNQPINHKVRDAVLAQFNYVVVVAEKDAGKKMVTLRERDRTANLSMTVDDLLKRFTEEIGLGSDC